MKKKPLSLEEDMEKFLAQARIDAIENNRLRLEYHLRTGLDNGVPFEAIAAVFDLPVQAVINFEKTGELKE